jgi:hypothetical protein
MRPSTAIALRLTRQVELGTHTVTIADEIVAGNGLRLAECRRHPKFAAIHMGSSRYFQWQELDARLEPDQDWAETLATHRRAHVVSTWSARPTGFDA